MIEKLSDGHPIKDVVNNWFDKCNLTQIIKYNVYSVCNFKINKQLDIGRVQVLKLEEIETLKEEGLDNPPDIRIYIDDYAINELNNMMINEGDPNLVKLSIERILEGITYDFEKDIIKYNRPTIQEYSAILKSYDSTLVTETYRVAIDQIQIKRKEEKSSN